MLKGEVVMKKFVVCSDCVSSIKKSIQQLYKGQGRLQVPTGPLLHAQHCDCCSKALAAGVKVTAVSSWGGSSDDGYTPWEGEVLQMFEMETIEPDTIDYTGIKLCTELGCSAYDNSAGPLKDQIVLTLSHDGKAIAGLPIAICDIEQFVATLHETLIRAQCVGSV